MNIFLGIKSFETHTSDEGWQLQLALQSTKKWKLAGHDLEINNTNVDTILRDFNPTKVVIQDPREWMGWNNLNVPAEKFVNFDSLKNHRATKICIIKDAQHFSQANEMFYLLTGVSQVIHYYSENIVRDLNPWLLTHGIKLIRTWHSIDPAQIPRIDYEGKQDKAILSGANNHDWYPFRHRLWNNLNTDLTDRLNHPGYKRTKTFTPSYLENLSKYKVCIATCSKLNYLLRKIIEGVCCGCRVITNLPYGEEVPAIDNCLVRVSSDISIHDMEALIKRLVRDYDPDKAMKNARKAILEFDYHNQGRLLNEKL